jgi:hypothetical protein
MHTDGSIYIQTQECCVLEYLYSTRISLPRHAAIHGQTDVHYPKDAGKWEQALSSTSNS